MLDFNGAGPKRDFDSYQVTTPEIEQYPVEKFLGHLADFGLVPGDIRQDGKLHRFDAEKGKRGDKVGWYVFYYGVGICGAAFGNWQTGLKETWCSKSKRDMTPREQASYTRLIDESMKQAAVALAKNQAAVQKATNEICGDSPVVEGDNHPYLKDKRVQAHGVRVCTKKHLAFPTMHEGDLLIPLFDGNGLIWSLEAIKPNGKKRFQRHGKKRGNWFEISGKKGNRELFIVEGYSTGATIHEQTGGTVIVAFDAGNMAAIAKDIKTIYQGLNISIAADNDTWTLVNGRPVNTGIIKAQEAGALIGAPVVYPKFKPESIEEWRRQTGKTDKGPTDYNDLAALEGGQAVRDQLAACAETVNNSPRKFKLVHLSDVKFKAPDWLIKGLIETDSLNLLFGDPASGKTFAAIDMVCCIATGKDFNGMPVKQGPVIYIAGEGQNGLKRRFTAWGIKNGINIDDYPIFLSLIPAALSETEQVLAVKEAIKELVDEYGPSALIVFDTVARNFGPGDENSTKDMTAFVAGLDDIRMDDKPGIMLVHHSGHGDKGRARGAMALKGALDTEYRVEKDENGTVRVENTKMKAHTKPNPMAFKLATVELGIKDEDGETITSAVLHPVQYTETKKGKGAKTELTGWAKKAFESFKDIYVEEQNKLIKNGKDFSEAIVFASTLRKHFKEELNMPKATISRMLNENLPGHPEISVLGTGDQFKYTPPFPI